MERAGLHKPFVAVRGPRDLVYCVAGPVLSATRPDMRMEACSLHWIGGHLAFAHQFGGARRSHREPRADLEGCILLIPPIPRPSTNAASPLNGIPSWQIPPQSCETHSRLPHCHDHLDLTQSCPGEETSEQYTRRSNRGTSLLRRWRRTSSNAGSRISV